jgi:formyltetrahydrofolate-dependent phosphoribosylglycinamide formyltransferase
MGSERLRIGVLISGAGRTLRGLVERVQRGALEVEIAVVISSSARARGVEFARASGLPCFVVDPREMPRPHFDERIAALLDEHRVQLVCMAGFLYMWRIPESYAGRVMNIHPALLPAYGGRGFYGSRVHRAVLDAGERESGCTVHFADNEYDHGPIILQRRVPVLTDDTVDSLAARVFAEELIAYPDAIRLFAAGRLKVVGDCVQILSR